MKKLVVAVAGWGQSAEIFDEFRAAAGDLFAWESFSLNDLSRTEPEVSPRAGKPSHYCRALLKLIGERDVCLVGLSAGGMAALEAAILSHRVKKLVLISSGARFTCAADFDCGTPPEQLEQMRLNLRRAPREVLRRFHLRALRPTTLSVEELEARIDAGLAQGVEELDLGLRFLSAFDVRDRLARVIHPVLAVHGSADLIISCRVAEQLPGGLPAGELELIEGAGHDLLVAHGARVAELAVEFFLR